MPTKRDAPPTYHSSIYFDKSTIKQAILLLEQGSSKSSVIQKFKMSWSTLEKWIVKYGSPELNAKKLTKLTALQRRSIALQIQQGILTIDQANFTYNITGHDTIAKWVRQLQSEKRDICDSSPVALEESIIIHTASDSEKIELRRALYEAELKIAALDTLIDVAEEQLKINIRKKPGANQSMKCKKSTQS